MVVVAVVAVVEVAVVVAVAVAVTAAAAAAAAAAADSSSSSRLLCLWLKQQRDFASTSVRNTVSQAKQTYTYNTWISGRKQEHHTCEGNKEVLQGPAIDRARSS